LQSIKPVGDNQENTMSRTLYQRVIADRLGSTPQGGRRRRGARGTDLDVANTRHQVPTEMPSTAGRSTQLY
jgi:hypothetical protein